MRSTPLLILSLAAVFAACGQSPSAAPDAGVVVDAGVQTDAGFDAGILDPQPACEGSGTCEVSWSESAALPAATDHHTTFIATSPEGTFLYVVGGVTADFSDVKEVYSTVRRARIAEDGSLGAWEDGGALPKALGFHAMAQVDRRVYLVAGVTKTSAGFSANGDTLIGDVGDDGMISWRVGEPVSQMLLHPSAQVLGSRLYVTGGAGQMAVDKVLVATLGADGSMSAFSSSAALPGPRSHHATAVRNGRIYVVGGLDAAHVPAPEVLRSMHDAEGAITGWEVAGYLADAPWTHSAFVLGEWLYLAGGGEGGPGQEKYVGRIRRARFNTEGVIPEAFEELVSPLPVERAHVHQTPVFEGRIYSAGGRLQPSLDTMDRVFVGSLSAP